MIYYEKMPDGDLNLRLSAEEVGEVYSMLDSAGLLQRRTFDGLKTYIKKNYADELEKYRRRMTAQIPLREKGGDHAAV